MHRRSRVARLPSVDLARPSNQHFSCKIRRDLIDVGLYCILLAIAVVNVKSHRVLTGERYDEAWAFVLPYLKSCRREPCEDDSQCFRVVMPQSAALPP